MSTCRNTCANGSPPGRRPRATSSSKSMSIRRAFCDGRTRQTVRRASTIGPQIAGVSLLDKGVDFRRLILVATGPRRKNLSERDALGFRPVLRLPEVRSDHRARAVEIAPFDVDPDRKQRWAARLAKWGQPIGIAEALGTAGQPQCLAGTGAQEDHADPAGLKDVLQTKREVVAGPLGKQNRSFVLDMDKPGFVSLWRHLDRTVAPGRGHQPERAGLEEVDRLFVEEGKDLGLGGLAGCGENVSQLLHGFELAHDCDPVPDASGRPCALFPQNLARPS